MTPLQAAMPEELRTPLPPWSKGIRFSAEAAKQLAGLGIEAVEPLILVMQRFCYAMWFNTGADLGIPEADRRFAIKPINKEIRRRLRDRWPNLCHGPAFSLLLIGRPAVPELLRLVDDEHWLIRVEAAWALGSIGDRSALPRLEAIAKWWKVWEFPETQRMARSAIRLIKEKSSV